MAEINLLKNEFQKSGPLSFVPKSLFSLYAVLGILLFELLVYGGMFFYQKSLQRQARNLEQKAASVDIEIERKSPDRKLAISFQRRLGNLQTLLDRHIFWTAGFEELQKYSLRSVRLRTLEVSEHEGVFVVTGTAPSVTDLGKYIAGLQKSSNVLDIELGSVRQSQSGDAGYDFGAEITFNTQLLQKK